MGQTLSEPVVNKLSSRGGDKRTAYGASAMQGWRVTMEDAHTALPNQGDASSNNNKEEHFGFYAVFDGHGGNSAAQYAAEFLHKNIISQDEFKAGDYEAALKKGFLTCDEQFYEDPRSVTNPSGCTAITALFTPDGRVFVANAGDSRAIISIKGTAQAMSIDHKPSVATEAARIKAAGGFIEFGRVNGNLALSRALGDFDFKKSQDLPPQQQVVTCDPEIMTINLKKEEHEFVVLACDGIWDCISNQALVDYIRMMITYHPYSTLDEICERIMDICLAPECEVGGLGSDNMSIMIVALLDGRTEDEWKQWVASNYRTQ
ncbi:protein phosphatase 2C, partial [Ramicandelaber brevisporus]